MKGISAIIATLLILLITIGLAGLAYSYISGVFTSKTMTISLVDAYCTGTDAMFIIRNDGTQTLPSTSVTATVIDASCTGGNLPTTESNNPLTSDISAGSTATLTATGCKTGRTHTWRLSGPSNSITLSVYCP